VGLGRAQLFDGMEIIEASRGDFGVKMFDLAISSQSGVNVTDPRLGHCAAGQAMN
jgi:hypothetical protein